MYDREEGLHKMWYAAYSTDYKKQVLCYAISPDGIAWRKHLTTSWNAEAHTKIVFGGTPEFDEERDWEAETEAAAFIPWGRAKQDWD
jgi:hypothetical protein